METFMKIICTEVLRLTEIEPSVWRWQCWLDSAGSGEAQVVRSCEHDNELPYSI